MRERGERARSGKESHLVTLSNFEISKMQSSRWQRIASVPVGLFEGYIEEAMEELLNEVTTQGLLRLLKEQEREEKRDENRELVKQTHSVSGPRSPC